MLVYRSAFCKSGISQTVISGIALLGLQNCTRLWNVVFSTTESFLGVPVWLDSPPHVASCALTVTWESEINWPHGEYKACFWYFISYINIIWMFQYFNN